MNKKILDLLNQYENVDSDSENKIEEAKKKIWRVKSYEKSNKNKSFKTTRTF